MGDHTIFVYGTLMAPEMLHRVIHGYPDPEPWQRALLRFRPAVLHGFRRHRVRGADYPGIVAAASSASVERESSDDKPTSVLGTLVSGLTQGDIHRLDLYEGDEYVRRQVMVRTVQGALGDPESSADGHLRDALDATAHAQFADEGDEVSAVTYVWVAGRERLEEAEWDFETFKRDKMAWWVARDESEW